MNLNKLIQSRMFRKVLYCLGFTVIALLIFHAGMFVGYRKATFTYRWEDNYRRNFMEPHRGLLRNSFSGDRFIEAHGTSGKIISISMPTFVIQGRDGAEKIVDLTLDTAIRQFHSIITKEDLRVNDEVVIIGTPNDKGEIEAKFIRVFPSPSSTMSPTDSSKIPEKK